jgi:4-carboxymuconolactone decarboxylase
MGPCAERITACDDVGRQEATMNEAELKQKTRDTAGKLFHTLKSGTGFEQWKKFDKQLARQLSMFFTGVLYSREVISQKQRELCAVASLTVLDRHNELRAHIHAALNVGATRQEVAEVIFQQVTYGGMPVVVEALDVYAKVLGERGEPFPAEETAPR